MDLDHDAVMRIGDDAPGDGPILWDGVTAMPASGHRHLGSLPVPGGHAANGHRLGSDNHSPAITRRPAIHSAGRSTTPSGTSPMVASRHNPMSSLRASATIIVLRAAPRASAVRRQCQRANALSFWKIRNRQVSS
jgi:hypothetical protein